MAEQRILIVDDEAYIRTVMAAILDRAGFVTATATSAQEAQERVEQRPALRPPALRHHDGRH